MTVKSNIAEVIANFEKLQAGLVVLPEKIFADDALLNLLKRSARVAVEAEIQKISDFNLAASAVDMADILVEGIMRSVTREGVCFTTAITPDLTAPPSLAAAAELNLDAHTKSGRIRKSALNFNEQGQPTGTSVLDEDENLKQVRAAITEWVVSEKHLTERDEGKTPDEIADDLMFILGVNETRRPYEDSGLRRDAAEGLLPHIQDFIDRASRGEVDGMQHLIQQTIPAEQVQRWLKAVLKAWRRDVPPWLRDRIEHDLEKLTKESLKGG